MFWILSILGRYGVLNRKIKFLRPFDQLNEFVKKYKRVEIKIRSGIDLGGKWAFDPSVRADFDAVGKLTIAALQRHQNQFGPMKVSSIPGPILFSVRLYFFVHSFKRAFIQRYIGHLGVLGEFDWKVGHEIEFGLIEERDQNHRNPSNLRSIPGHVLI